MLIETSNYSHQDPWFAYRIGEIKRAFRSFAFNPIYSERLTAVGAILETHPSCKEIYVELTSKELTRVTNAIAKLSECEKAFYEIWDYLTSASSDIIYSSPYMTGEI